MLHGLPVQPGGEAAACRGRGSDQAAGTAERGEDQRRLGALPRGDASGAAGRGGRDGAELPGAAKQAEHLHPGLHESPGFQESSAAVNTMTCEEIFKIWEIDRCLRVPCSRRCGPRGRSRSRTCRPAFPWRQRRVSVVGCGATGVVALDLTGLAVAVRWPTSDGKM